MNGVGDVNTEYCFRAIHGRLNDAFAGDATMMLETMPMCILDKLDYINMFLYSSVGVHACVDGSWVALI